MKFIVSTILKYIVMTFYYSKQVIIVVLFVMFGSILFGQNNERKAIKSMFDNTSNGLWIRSYTGTFDEVFPLTLLLGTSGTECRGIIKYANNASIFTVEGNIINDIYTLHEFDSDGQSTANIILKKQENTFSGEWLGIKGLKKYSLFFEKTKSIDGSAIPCNSSFSSRFYKDKNGNIAVQYFKNDNNLKMTILIDDNVVEWVADKNTSFETELIYFNDKIEENKITYKVIPLKDNMCLLRINNGNTQINHHLFLEKNLVYNCNYHIDYNLKAEVHYPILDDVKFNQWMQKTIKSIWSNQVHSLKNETVGSNTPQDRIAKELYIYTRVYNISKKWISGLFFVQSEGMDQLQTIAFTYNIDKHKQIDVSKIWKNKETDNPYLSYIENAQRNATLLPVGLERNWLMNTTYNHIILVDNAIVLFTDFNIIFGNRNIRIPYREFKDHLKIRLK